MGRYGRIAAIILAVLLLGSVAASAAAVNGDASGKGDASASAAFKVVLEWLGLAAPDLPEVPDVPDIDGPTILSDIEVMAGFEATIEQRIQAETPALPDFPDPRAELYGKAHEVFRMTALADQTVVLTYDAGVVGTLKDATTVNLNGPGFKGQIDLVGTADAAAGGKGYLEADTGFLVAHMQEGETLVMTAGDTAYQHAANVYGLLKDKAQVKVDQTVSAYMELKAHAKAELAGKERWAYEQANFHKAVVESIAAQVRDHAQLTLHSAMGAVNEAGSKASGEISGSANGAASAAGSAAGAVTGKL